MSTNMDRSPAHIQAIRDAYEYAALPIPEQQLRTYEQALAPYLATTEVSSSIELFTQDEAEGRAEELHAALIQPLKRFTHQQSQLLAGLDGREHEREQLADLLTATTFPANRGPAREWLAQEKKQHEKPNLPSIDEEGPSLSPTGQAGPDGPPR